MKKSSDVSGMLRALGMVPGGVCVFDVVAEQHKRGRQGATEGPTWATQEAHRRRLWDGGGLLITTGTGKYSTRATAEGREAARSRRGAHSTAGGRRRCTDRFRPCE
jgi:hypothetical protein